MPLKNPVGFGTADFVELGLAVALVLAVLFSGRLLRAAERLAEHPVWAMLWVALAPVVLRWMLLAVMPVPVPDIYDEFGHLFVADTLRHWRLANPPHAMHRFFETFFILQQPTHSSIYPIGNGVALALGEALFGTAWAGVLGCAAALCGGCYWMLRGWVSPGWALLGGALAGMEFGPFCQWTNSYWGGALAGAAGCLVFGALPRLRECGRRRDGVLLGLGLGIHLLTRPYESLFLGISVVAFFAVFARSRSVVRPVALASFVLLPFLAVTLLQNQRVTGHWDQLPYSLSQYQYGVPAGLTFQAAPVPHLALTREQEMDYRMQREFHPGMDSLGSYFGRLWFRVRYYRFYFYSPLYLALGAFIWGVGRRKRLPHIWVLGTCVLLGLGTNFFPAFQYHYLAGVVCLFVLMSVEGLRLFPRSCAVVIVVLCLVQFAMTPRAGVAVRRVDVSRELDRLPGKLLVFVRYWPSHAFQDEWVYNGADIDSQRVVWARDLGDEEDKRLIAYYPGRKALLLEPDARPPALDDYSPAAEEKTLEPHQQNVPLMPLEQVH